jgi:hypothetical protein
VVTAAYGYTSSGKSSWWANGFDDCMSRQQGKPVASVGVPDVQSLPPRVFDAVIG